MPEPLILSLSRVHLKSTHHVIKMYPVGIFQRTHKELTKNSQSSSISPQTLKELTKYPLGTFWLHGGYFLNEPSTNSKWVAQAYSEHIMRWFVKETKGFFHKVSARYFFVWIVKGIKGFAHNSTNIYPLGSWWVLFKCTQWVNQYHPQRVLCWVLFENTQHVPGGYLGGWIEG